MLFPSLNGQSQRRRCGEGKGCRSPYSFAIGDQTEVGAQASALLLSASVFLVSMVGLLHDSFVAGLG